MVQRVRAPIRRIAVIPMPFRDYKISLSGRTTNEPRLGLLEIFGQLSSKSSARPKLWLPGTTFWLWTCLLACRP